ncbi:MAG: ABC transporter ATP-binding protein [Burkholderiaceae bacterium]|nr:ABC transporter ATP-binding protein [Microbacteriaceae bacterium]
MIHLSLSNVVVGYSDEPVLRGVSLDVPRGSLVAIVGPSGCGKTTLLRTIAGLIRARSGEVRLGGRMVATHGIHLAPEKRRIGWVPQDAALFPHLTVAENIAFALGGGRRAARRAAGGERVCALLELVGLGALADRIPAQLSGGQAQRVALARAIASDPDVVLLDEPFGALDPLLRGELRSEVRALLRAEGMTGILVTHDQGEALSIADYVAVMNNGEILQFGRPSEVYERPATPWVAGFVGESVFIDGTGTGDGHSLSALGALPTEWAAAAGVPADGAAVTVLVRPEQLALDPIDTDTGSVAGRVLATVTTVSYTGHDALLGLRLDEGTVVQSRVAAAGLLPIGARVAVTVHGRLLAYPPTP